jgi:hypothetical protein
MDGTAHVIGSDDVDRLALTVGVFATACLAAGVILDNGGVRSFAFWPHAAALWGGLWVSCTLGPDARGGLLAASALAIGAGVWLGRSFSLLVGGLVAWVTITSLAPSPGTIMVSGIGLIGVAIWLASSRGRVRIFLEARRLPGPPAAR